MKPVGETLYLERKEVIELSTIRLLKKALDSRQSDVGSEPSSLGGRIAEWLEEGNETPYLPLTVEDVEVCIEAIQSQRDIAAETPGVNDPKGTATPNSISQATRLLPEMEEFVAGNKQSGE